MRTLIRRLLEEAGHRVLEAEDGAAGLRLFAREKPDLVITDLFMPNKEGIETIRDIRTTSNVPVLAVSGGGVRKIDLLDLMVPLGATEVLAKPFRRAEFLAVIERLLARNCKEAQSL
jgi:DNA-binding response OmpR family regulator